MTKRTRNLLKLSCLMLVCSLPLVGAHAMLGGIVGGL